MTTEVSTITSAAPFRHPAGRHVQMSVRFFPAWTAFLRDLDTALQHFVVGLSANPLQALPYRFIDGRRHTFAGEARKFPCQATRLFNVILNVQDS